MLYLALETFYYLTFYHSHWDRLKFIQMAIEIMTGFIVLQTTIYKLSSGPLELNLY